MAWSGGGPCWGLLGMVLVIQLMAGAARAQQPLAQTGGELAMNAVRQSEALLAAKAQRPSAQREGSSQFLDTAGRARHPAMAGGFTLSVNGTLLVPAGTTPSTGTWTNDLPQAVTTCSGGMAGTYPCSNVDLMSFLALADIGGGSANDIWGWDDSLTGKEYAIMGRPNGTSFVDISDPANPIYLGNLPPHSTNSIWRDIKVYADHAFIVTEANNSGMQVFDLTQLRAVASPPATFSETTHYSGFLSAHNLVINEDSGFAYAAGTNNCSGGLHMINIQNLTDPTAAGCFSADGYTHDAQCVNYDGPDLDHQGKEICFNSNEDTLTIVDVTNKASPALLSRTGYSGSRYTHQGWLTEDQAYFLLGDELDEMDNPDVTNTSTYMWDVSNLDGPALIGVHESTTTATDHNQYVKGSYTYQSNYRAGLRILDITGIANGNLSEEAFFDVYPGSDSPADDGTWSNYPFFDSGMVIVSAIEQGLFILRPSLSGAPVPAMAPALSSASVNGATLTLTYGEALNGRSTPAADDFTVSGGDSARTVSNVAVSGRAVTLTLNPAVGHGETGITVSYRPGANPIQGAAGNDALGLSSEPVTNNTGDTTAPTVSRVEITSRPERDETYAAGKEIAVTVTFSETVVVTGTPRLRLNVGGVNRTAAYRSGPGAAAVFVYMVADGESDTDGVSIEADRLSRNGGRIRDGADNDALLNHDAVAADSRHKVDGVKPVFESASVDGATLVLTYGETLDGSSAPVAAAFTVNVEGDARRVSRVAVSGTAVMLTLEPEASVGQGVRITYRVPGAQRIQDAVGNAAEAITNRAVENNTEDTMAPAVSRVAVTSNPGPDGIYAEEDVIEVTVMFNETVRVDTTNGTPSLTLRVGRRSKPAHYIQGPRSAALRFTYTVEGDDIDTDGVSLAAGRIALNGGTIKDLADNPALLAYEAVPPQPGHAVDGVRPGLERASVDGATLTLTYGEALDGNSRPAPDDFTVTVADTERLLTLVPKQANNQSADGQFAAIEFEA